MEVCTKLLDVKNLNKVQLKILKTIGIWFVTFIISLALLVNLNKNEHIEILVCHTCKNDYNGIDS